MTGWASVPLPGMGKRGRKCVHDGVRGIGYTCYYRKLDKDRSGDATMLTIWGDKTGTFCDGIGRREFLRIGALGGALSLADKFRLQAAGPARPPTPNKSVIMVYLLGGPAQLDTYDPKPEAPAEYRGEFKS